MNYRQGFFRLWVVVACVIIAVPTIASYNEYVDTDEKDLFLIYQREEREHWFSDQCNQKDGLKIIYHEWQAKKTKFRLLSCFDSNLKFGEESERMIAKAMKSDWALSIDKKNYDYGMQVIRNIYGLAAWVMAVWIAILVSIWYVLEGLRKPKYDDC